MTPKTGRKHFVLLLNLLLMLVLCNCYSSRQPARTLTRVRIAVPDSGFAYSPVFLAQELGFYRDEGLDTTLEAVYGGGSKSMGAILGRSVDCGGISLELAIQLAAEGRRVQSFVTLIDRASYVLAVSPFSKREIHAIEDLRDAAVGVSSTGSGSHNFANYVLATHKVPRARVSIVGIGLGAPAVAAFDRGQIDAGVLVGNSITVLERRFPRLRILADSRTAEGAKAVWGTDVYPAQGLAASPDWLHRNPATASKVARALMQATQYMRDHSPEEIRRRMPAQFRSSDKEADVEALRETVTALSRDGRISKEGALTVKKVLEVSSDRVRLASIDLSQTYTNEFVTFPLQTR